MGTLKAMSEISAVAGVRFDRSGKEAIVVKLESKNDVILPAFVMFGDGSLAVTEIGREAFKKSAVKSITVSQNVKVLG
jgi:hypothetical protein